MTPQTSASSPLAHKADRLVRWFLPADFDHTNHEQWRIARMLTWCSLLMGTNCFLGPITLLLNSSPPNFLIYSLLIGGLYFLSIPFSLKFFPIWMAGTTLCLGVFGMLILTAFVSSGVYSSSMMGFFLLTSLGFFVGSSWLGTVALLASLLAVGTLTFLNSAGFPFPKEPFAPDQRVFFPLAYFFLLITNWLIIWFFEGSRKASFNASQHMLRELVVARDVAEEASRAKSQLLANVSHELRTPLNAIIGYSEMLEEEFHDIDEEKELPFSPKTMSHDLGNITTSARRLLSLINDLLDLSKIEARQLEFRPEVVSIPALFEQLKVECHPLSQRNENTLHFQVAEGAEEFIIDRLRLEQILTNLISNACKFTQRGKVHVEARRIQRQGASWLSLRVRDNGIGMSAQQQELIFQPFRQARTEENKNQKGTGLGLAITKELCLAMEGTIHVESQEGEGSVFTVRFPYTSTSPPDT